MACEHPDMLDMLKRLGWTQKIFASRIGVRPATISEWGAAPPEYALAYLRLACRVRDASGELHSWVHSDGKV